MSPAAGPEEEPVPPADPYGESAGEDEAHEEPPQAEVEQVAYWMRRTAATPDFTDAVEQYKEDQETLLGDEADNDDLTKVTVNHIYRNSIHLVALMVPSNHGVEWRPYDVAEVLDGDLMDPAVAQLRDAAEQELRRRRGFAGVLGVIVRRLSQEVQFQEHVEAFVQDSAHFRLAVMKVTWQADYAQDVLSVNRQPDQQDNLARLRVLAEGYARQEFDVNDQRFAEMKDLMQSTGQAEVPIRFGINVELIPPPMYRMDPRITRAEDFQQAGWHRHDVIMYRDEILAKYDHLTMDDFQQAKPAEVDEIAQKAKESARERESATGMLASYASDEADDGEGAAAGGRTPYVVSEIWDMESNRYRVACEGVQEWLVNRPISGTYKGRAPFVGLVMNRVHGRLYGLSDTELQAKLQAMINQKRTEEEEARFSSYSRWGYDPSVIDEVDIGQWRRALPNTPVAIRANGRDFDEAIKEFKTNGAFNPAMFDTSKEDNELRQMSGLPPQALGAVKKAGFAEEVKEASAGAAALSRYRKDRTVRALCQAYDLVAHYAVHNLPLDSAVKMAGPAAQLYWPPDQAQRESLYEELNVRVRVTMDRHADNLQRATVVSRIMDTAARQGQPMGDIALRYLARLLDEDDELQDELKPSPDLLAARLGYVVKDEPQKLSDQGRQIVQGIAVALGLAPPPVPMAPDGMPVEGALSPSALPPEAGGSADA